MSERPVLLITECPSCYARFRISAEQVKAAEGRVRCGACLTIFKGAQHLRWGSGQETARIQLSCSEGLSDLSVEAVDKRVELDRLPVDHSKSLVGSYCDESGKLSNPDVASAQWRSSWLGLGILLAAIALAAQVLWYQVERWSHIPELQEIYQVFCEIVPCPL